MRYALVVVTHGHAPHLDEAVAAFAEHVTPAPHELLCVVDGHGRMPPAEPLGPWEGTFLNQPSGFCVAARAAWQLAAGCRSDYVFWLENDFLVRRPVALDAIAGVLELRAHAETLPPLAQVALLRQPVNGREVAAGGLVAADPEDFTARVTSAGEPWLEHARFWTTNPSLFPASLARDVAWPVGPYCEGKLGVGLVAAGWRFGLWGDGGEAWVHHVGTRTGFGY